MHPARVLQGALDLKKEKKKNFKTFQPCKSKMSCLFNLVLLNSGLSV